MNAIIVNKYNKILKGLNVTASRILYGEYDAEEIIILFKDNSYQKIIIDITAIKNYKDEENIRKIAKSLDVDKIILFIGNDVISDDYLSKLISMGIYKIVKDPNSLKNFDDIVAKIFTKEDENIEKKSEPVFKEIPKPANYEPPYKENKIKEQIDMDELVRRINEKIAKFDDEEKQDINTLLKEIEPDVDQEMINRGLMKIVAGEKQYRFGSINSRFEIEKRLLKEKYGIDWKTPNENEIKLPNGVEIKVDRD